MERRGFLVSVAGMSLVLAACGDVAETASNDPSATDQGSAVAQVDVSQFHPDGWPGASKDFADDLYDPVDAGEDLPDGFRQVLGRDWINPVYTPTFTEPDQVNWSDDELVIGVDLEGEARAYPVGFLNRREIVVDMHRGIPTFVTW